MAASYISKHHGGGWRYTYHIPEKLRLLFKDKKGKPLAAFRRYIKRTTKSDAEAIARVRAVEDRETLAQARVIPEGQRWGYGAIGGLQTDHTKALAAEETVKVMHGLYGLKDPLGHALRAGARNLQAAIEDRKIAAVVLPNVSWGALFT